MERLATLEQELSVEYRSGLLGRTERVIVEQVRPIVDEPRENMSALRGGHVTQGDRDTLLDPIRKTPTPPSPLKRGRGHADSLLAVGRADRYFEIHFDCRGLTPGCLAHVRIDRVTPTRTHGTWSPAQCAAE
jgi:hypothetical protein